MAFSSVEPNAGNKLERGELRVSLSPMLTAVVGVGVVVLKFHTPQAVGSTGRESYR